MDTLIGAVAPAFACGLALQRGVEVLDPLLDKFISEHKKWILAWFALVAGILFAWIGELRVLNRLGITDKDALDFVVTALIVSAGTEGFNSLFKFLGYAKENKKQEAAQKQAPAAAVTNLQNRVG